MMRRWFKRKTSVSELVSAADTIAEAINGKRIPTQFQVHHIHEYKPKPRPQQGAIVLTDHYGRRAVGPQFQVRDQNAIHAYPPQGMLYMRDDNGDYYLVNDLRIELWY